MVWSFVGQSAVIENVMIDAELPCTLVSFDTSPFGGSPVLFTAEQQPFDREPDIAQAAFTVGQTISP